MPPHARNRPAGQRDGGNFGRDDRRGGTSPDAGAPHFFRPTCPTCLPPTERHGNEVPRVRFSIFPPASATESRAIGPGGDATSGRDPRPRCDTPHEDSPARSSADAARDIAVRGSEQTLNARENARAGSAPRCAFRGFRREASVGRLFFRAFFLARRAEREARRLTVQTQSSIDARF